MGINFGELKKETVFFKSGRWYKKVSNKESGKTVQSSGWGSAQDERGRTNFFGNNQEVERYEFRQICEW